MSVLGIWYSNNNIAPAIAKASLDSVSKAKEASHVKVSVRTSTWRPLIGSPFPGSLTPYRLPTHMGIVIQILRGMYAAENDREPFEVVCLLEHDVLYPDDYFDRVSEAFDGAVGATVVSNLDYIGLNETGWLGVAERHEPLHQLSMEAAFALDHFQALLQLCVREPIVTIEPPEREGFVRIPFEGTKPSCHINHSGHFTDHFRIYERERFCERHPYWGDFRDYYPDGESSIDPRTLG